MSIIDNLGNIPDKEKLIIMENILNNLGDFVVIKNLQHEWEAFQAFKEQEKAKLN